MSTKTTQTISVWTRAYRPFIMGGDVNRNVSTEVPWDIVVELRKLEPEPIAVKLYRIMHPHSGKCYYVEEVSKGLMGDDLNSIAEDFHQADSSKLERQLKEMSDVEAEIVDADTFWEILE